jgi:hypothetical protein
MPYMLLEMMLAAIFSSICMPCGYNRFAMREVGICTVNVVILTFSAGIVFTGETLEYWPQQIARHLAVCLRLLIQPRVRVSAVLDRNREESDY